MGSNMFEVKSYVGNYDKNEFYMTMGKYFAERIYRKRLPYLINDKDKVWYLFFKNHELAGFCGVKICQQYTTISDVYYIEKYKEDNILEQIIYYIFNAYKLENIRLLSNNTEEVKIWESLGVKANGKKGSYVSMSWIRSNEKSN